MTAEQSGIGGRRDLPSVLDGRTMARVAAALWVGCGALVALLTPLLPRPAAACLALTELIGIGAVTIGVVVWFLPWDRWHPSATLALVPTAFGVIALFNRAMADPWLYMLFFTVSVVWVGLAHPQGTTSASSPLLLVAYLAPMVGRLDGGVGLASLAFALPVCVLLGESAAYVASRLRAAEAARARSQAELAHLAGHDPLTGLANRSALLSHLEHVLQGDEAVAVAFIDLDAFKVVNDSLGHAAGDVLLVAVAERLGAALPPAPGLASLCRLGGDEFVVIAPGLAGETMGELVDDLLATLREPLVLSGRRHVVTASVGIAVGGAGCDPSDLVRRADLAMYRSKELGGDRWTLFDESLARTARRRLDIETELRAALEQRELVLHLQPELDLVTEHVVCVEALVRWQHPERGLLPPSEFIDVAEQSGLIVELGTMVLRDACTTAAEWFAELGPDAPQISVNVSPRQLRSGDIVEVVAAALADAGLPADRLRLEITEGTILDGATPRLLCQLRDLGVSLAIDDFGTGYSSLSHLHRLDVDTVKIDRSFLADVVADDDRAPVVEATIGLARSLGLHVVAEGVETPAQLALLMRLGCERVQGFFFSRPLPRRDLDRYLADHQPRRLGGRIELGG